MDPTFLSATILADLVRTGKLGALELLDHYIARTEKHDSSINAVVVRACALISSNLDPANPQDGVLRVINRNALEPLLRQARALQAA